MPNVEKKNTLTKNPLFSKKEKNITPLYIISYKSLQKINAQKHKIGADFAGIMKLTSVRLCYVGKEDDAPTNG